MNIAETVEFINRNPVFTLATCIDNIPYVRNMLMIKGNEAEILFNAKKYKAVYYQLNINPNVELCFYDKESGTQIRISGRVVEIYDTLIIEDILTSHPDLRNQIVKYGKDVICLFSLKDWKASLWKSSNKEITMKIG